MNIIVLGAGLVGKAIAIDLAKDHAVTSVDIQDEALQQVKAYGVTPVKADLSDSHQLAELICDYDLVVGAVPGFMGFQTVRTVIEAGKNMVDISFFPEDPFQLDALAKTKNVTVIPDCGVAPGM